MSGPSSCFLVPKSIAFLGWRGRSVIHGVCKSGAKMLAHSCTCVCSAVEKRVEQQRDRLVLSTNTKSKSVLMQAKEIPT